MLLKVITNGYETTVLHLTFGVKVVKLFVVVNQFAAHTQHIER